MVSMTVNVENVETIISEEGKDYFRSLDSQARETDATSTHGR